MSSSPRSGNRAESTMPQSKPHESPARRPDPRLSANNSFTLSLFHSFTLSLFHSFARSRSMLNNRFLSRTEVAEWSKVSRFEGGNSHEDRGPVSLPTDHL